MFPIQPPSLQQREVTAQEFLVLAGITLEDAEADTVLEETPAQARARTEGQKSLPRRDQCMDCTRPPTKDVLWAEGLGRAWFCDRHFQAWSKEHADDIVKAHDVAGGEVPEHWRDWQGKKF